MSILRSMENQYERSNKKEKWEYFIENIEHLPKEFKVIGINGHFF